MKVKKRASSELRLHALPLSSCFPPSPGLWRTTRLTVVHALMPVSHRPRGGTMTLWAASCHKAPQSKQFH